MTRAPERRFILMLAFFGAALTGLRLWYASALPLSPDETYYWTWSRDLALSYSDHPPLAAWLIRVGTSLLGESALGVRLLTVLIAGFSIPILYLTGRSAGLDPHGSFLASLAASLLPVVSSASVIATPDTPLALCWLIAAAALVRLCSRGSHANWYLLGAALGAGILAKHAAFLALPMSLIVTLGCPETRRGLRTVHPWSALLLGSLLAAPYLLSETAGGFVSFRHQLAHMAGALPAGNGAGTENLAERVGGLLGGQIGLMTPPLAFVIALAAVRAKRLAPPSRALMTAALLPLAAASAVALASHPEQNWASLGHPSAAILAFAFLSGGANRPPLELSAGRWRIAILTTATVFATIIHTHALSPFLPLPPDRDPVSRLHGWKELAGKLPPLEGIDSVVCDNYGLASQLQWSYRNRDAIPIFSTDRGADPPGGDWLVLDEEGDWGDHVPRARCDSMARVGEIALGNNGGRPLRIIEVSRGSGCLAAPE